LHEQLVSGDDEGAWGLQPRANGDETRPSLNKGRNSNEIHVRIRYAGSICPGRQGTEASERSESEASKVPEEHASEPNKID